MFKRGRFLTPEAKWIYATLRSFTNNDSDKTFPSYSKIEERSGLNRMAISRALRELEHFHWIRKTKKFSKSTDYFLSYPTVQLPDGTLAPDQTCPTKADAAAWNKFLREERKAAKRRTEARKEREEGLDDEPPF